MENLSADTIQADVNPQVTKIRLLYEAALAAPDDPYHYREYYGRSKKMVDVPGDDFEDEPGLGEDGVDVWFHPGASELGKAENYFLHYPIVEEIALHRMEILVTATRDLVKHDPNLTKLLDKISENFKEKLKALADAYWELSQVHREKKQYADDKAAFHRKSATVRWYLDKLHEDMTLLVARADLPASETRELLNTPLLETVKPRVPTRESLLAAASKLNIATQKAYPQCVKRDLLQFELGNDKRGTWQYFNRHYIAYQLEDDRSISLLEGEPTFNSHDNRVRKLPNYARASYGICDVTAGFECKEFIYCSRFGTPINQDEYVVHALSPHLRRYYIAVAYSQSSPPGYAHIHTHLISSSGIGSYLQHQREMFEDSCVAAMSIRPAGFMYCSFGVNSFRRGTDRRLELQNQIALLDFYGHVRKVYPTAFTSFPDIQQAAELYENAMLNLVSASQNYLNTIGRYAKAPERLREPDITQLLNGMYDTYLEQEERVRSYAVQYFEQVRTAFLSEEFTKSLETFDTGRYYPVASLRLIFEIMNKNYGHSSWAAQELNGTIQALIQVAASRAEISASYGCMSANDRSILVSMILKELTRRLRDSQQPFKITLANLREITKTVHCQYSQDISVMHTIKDTGAPPKYVPHKTYETRGLKKSLMFTRFARHKNLPHLQNALKHKPAEWLGEFNFIGEHETPTKAPFIPGAFTGKAKDYIHALMADQTRPDTIKAALLKLFEYYPQQKTFRHTRQTQLQHIQKLLHEFNADDRQSRQQLMQQLWFLYSGMKHSSGMFGYYVKVALLKLLSAFANDNQRLDFPELILTSNAKLQELLMSAGVLNHESLKVWERVQPHLRVADEAVTCMKYKFGFSASTLKTQIDKGVTILSELNKGTDVDVILKTQDLLSR